MLVWFPSSFTLKLFFFLCCRSILPFHSSGSSFFFAHFFPRKTIFSFFASEFHFFSSTLTLACKRHSTEGTGSGSTGALCTCHAQLSLSSLLYHQRPMQNGFLLKTSRALAASCWRGSFCVEKNGKEKRDEQRLRFERKFPRVVRVIEPQGCLSREMCVQLCKCLRIFSFWLITLTMTRLNSSPLKSWPGTCRGVDRPWRRTKNFSENSQS